MNWIMGELVRGASIVEIEERLDMNGYLTKLSNGRIFLTQFGEQSLFKEVSTGNPHNVSTAPAGGPSPAVVHLT